MKRLMMFTTLLVIFASLSAFPMLPEQTIRVVETVKTQPIPSARYEFIQSTIAAKASMKLDRYTGDVWNLQVKEDNSLIMTRIFVSEKRTFSESKSPRFSLFLSQLAIMHTYLIDTENGDMWQLVELSEEKGKPFYFKPIPPSGDEYENVKELLQK